MPSVSKYYAIQNSLLRKGYIREQRINLGGRGGLTNFLEITKDGCSAIGVKSKPHLTRGGNFITDVFIVKITENLKSIMIGWKISIEKEVQGKFVDIVAEEINQQCIMAVEVELSEANLKNNIEKDCSKVNILIEVCMTNKIMEKAKDIAKDLPVNLQHKIGVCLLTDLFRCSKLSDVIDLEILKKRGL